MREQEIAVGLRERRVAVGDVHELGAALQPLRQRAAERREPVGLGALDPDQEQPRRDPPAQLADGPLTRWPNRGRLGGAFVAMNLSPQVSTVLGRKAVLFAHPRWTVPLENQALVLAKPPKG